MDLGFGEAKRFCQENSEGLVGFAVDGGRLNPYAQHRANERVMFPADDFITAGIRGGFDSEGHGGVVG